MKKLMIVTSSNRTMEACTRDAIHACERYGARAVWQTGSADVVFARNHALTLALQLCDAVEDTNPVDVVLMVDDDIEFTPDALLTVVGEARARQRPCSAVYVTINELPAAEPLCKDKGTGKQLWQVGLGFLAIPVSALRALRAESRTYIYRSAHQKTEMVEWCWSGVESGLWKSEDFVLCRRLGGVYLLPVDVGHRKMLTLRPNAKTLEDLANADR